MIVTVSLAAAVICFSDQCHPALVGKATPTGRYTLEARPTEQPLYGGDVMVFRETESSVLAVHRVWLGNPPQRRLERLDGPVQGRRGVTGGCINVRPAVYQQLVECCDGATLIIKEK